MLENEAVQKGDPAGRHDVATIEADVPRRSDLMLTECTHAHAVRRTAGGPPAPPWGCRGSCTEPQGEFASAIQRRGRRGSTLPVVAFFLGITLRAQMGHAQYSYQVRFKDIENTNNLPQVECGNNFPRDSEDAACQSCSAACGVNKASPECLCENVFQIATTEVNLFNGLDEDVTVCEVEDTNGNRVNLGDNDFRIELKTKSTTFNAPEGHIISLRSNEDFQCVNGVWNIKYSTSIAGQYVVSVQRKTGESAAGEDILAPLSTADFVTSPFEIPATKVKAGLANPANYFIDMVASLRPVCTSAVAGCDHCIFTPGVAGTSCTGNDYVPSVMDPNSQILVYPGDRYYNAVWEMCEPAGVVGNTYLRALKIPFRECGSNQFSGGKRLCAEAVEVKRDVSEWQKMQVTVKCLEDEEFRIKPTEYYVQFTPSYSGFYSIEVRTTEDANPDVGFKLETGLGPLIVPVDAAKVDAAQTFAHGQGILGVVQSELATFSIQPMDSFGNHHTGGMHVFQVEIQQIDPPSAFSTEVELADSDISRGVVLVAYQLERPAVYEVSVRYCKDLAHYPPFSVVENRDCDLDAEDKQGPHIKDSPFRVTIDAYEFYTPLINEPGLMTQFRTGDVGVRYYALFTGNFPLCDEMYGSPTIHSRYNPTIRFDPVEMIYTNAETNEVTPFLPASGVREDDVNSGKYASVRYTSYAGKCLSVPGESSGYIFTFLITVSGTYKVWLYSDTQSPRIVAESPRTFTVFPDVPVTGNYRGSGPVIVCTQEIDCMANQPTKLSVRAKDRFFNDAQFCGDNISVHVVPVFADTDHFTVSNLEDVMKERGVSMGGQPGPFLTESTRSGYVAESIHDFYGTILSCDQGLYDITVLATLSAEYTVSVTVNNIPLEGSPFDLVIYPQQVPIMPDVTTFGLVTVTRWTYYRIYFDQDNTGFGVEVSKIDANEGQPWTFMRYEGIFADIQEPDFSAGIRYEYPDVRQSIFCRTCRIHVPPNRAKIGLYFVSVYGYEDDSYHSILVSRYKNTVIHPGDVVVDSLEPGKYAYYRFKIAKTSGFQIRVGIVGATQASLTATLKKGDYPLKDDDPSNVLGQSLMQKNCFDCIIDHPPSKEALGDWYLSVIGHVQLVTFQVALIEFSETQIEFGSQSNRQTLQPLTWGYYLFTIELDMEPDGFKVDVIPSNTAYNLTTVLKRAQHPITLTDSTFKSKPCTHCRITIMTRQRLQATWYVGVYAGATGGEFDLKVKLLESCPNECFGNGVCVQRKIKVCRCFPGYTGIDCRDAIKEKVFAWYPLDGSAADQSGNKRPFFYKTNSEGSLKYANDGLDLRDSFIIMPKPTPAVACSQFLRMAEPTPADLQWGDEQTTDLGTTDRNRVQAIVPEVGDWYTWNELGKAKGNPRIGETCAEYNPRREMTIMFHVRVDERGLSPGSLMTLGKPSLVVGRHDADEVGKWSWSLYPVPHPNGRHIVFDMYLRNLTHEVSLREEEIYEIDGKPIFEKPDFWTRTFPNGWCRDSVRPANADGLCEYMDKKEYYHIAAVFAPRRVELYIDATLVGVAKLDLWNLTDTPGGRIQFGHDPRYSPYERLFFGQVRDIRILRYAASLEEITSVLQKGDTWFKWRQAVRNQVGLVKNLGSAKDPIPLTGLDDGSLDPDLSPHAEVCQTFRTPNEPREMHRESNCPFIDTDTSWILTEDTDRFYRKYDTDRTPFGLGHEELILVDSRPKQEVYLGRFYDFSIDEE